MNLEEIKNKLTELAFERTSPFCYSCYEICPSGRCNNCGSDDLMRHLEDVGVEYGTEWVIESIVKEELQSIDTEEIFEQMIDDHYGDEIIIGFIKSSPSIAIKTLNPIAWDIAKSEHIDFLIEDEQVLEIGGEYYWVTDIEDL